MKTLLLALATAFAFQAKAQILNIVPSSQTMHGVAIAKTATAAVGSQTVNLTTVAAGIRQDKPFFSESDIYVGQLLVDNPSVVVKTPADFLTSSDSIKVGAITMSFVYAWAPESNIYQAYQAAFAANHVSMTGPSPIADFLSSVNDAGGAGNGTTVTLLMVREPGQDVLTYVANNGTNVTFTRQVKGAPGFLHAIYSIWLGNPADNEITKLQNQWLSWKPAP